MRASDPSFKLRNVSSAFRVTSATSAAPTCPEWTAEESNMVISGHERPPAQTVPIRFEVDFA